VAETDERLVGWVGLDLFDVNGDEIGTVTDVRYGEWTGGLVWLIVKAGLLGVKKVAVPANEVDKEGGRLVARIDKDKIKHAPWVDSDKILGDEEEEKLCTYYGLDFVSSPWKATEGCVDPVDEAGEAGAGTPPGAGS